MPQQFSELGLRVVVAQLHFDGAVAEVLRVDDAVPRIEVGRRFDSTELKLDAHGAGVDLDARRPDISVR